MSKYEEAFSLLGLKVGATDDEIRRAYLRGIRRFRPEQDPEGFRRLRAAYELLSTTAAQGPRAVDPVDPSPSSFDQHSVELPGELREEEPRSAETSDGPEFDTRVLLSLPDVAEALAELDRLLTAAAERGAPPPVVPALHLVLRGHAEGAVEAARRTTRNLKDCLHRQGGGEQLRGAYEAVLWLEVRELMDLPDDFPTELRSALATARLQADSEIASDAFHHYAKSRPKAAWAASRILDACAPHLHGLYGDVLSGPRSERYSAMQRGLPLGLIAVLLTLWIQYMPIDDHRPGVQHLTPAEQQQLEELRRQLGSIREVDAARARAVVDRQCRPENALSGKVCPLSERAVTALEGDDCSAARRAFEALDRLWTERYGAAAGPRSWEPFATVEAAVANECRTESPEGGR